MSNQSRVSSFPKLEASSSEPLADALDDGGVPERCFPSRCFHLPQSRIDPIADGEGARAGRQGHGSDKGPRGTRREAFSAGRGINRRYIFVAIFIVSRRFRLVVRADDSAVAEPQWEHLMAALVARAASGRLACALWHGAPAAQESSTKAARQRSGQLSTAEVLPPSLGQQARAKIDTRPQALLASGM